MGVSQYLTLLLTHPLEFRTLFQYWLYHQPQRDITLPENHATSGWDRPTMRTCWDFLDRTSRSFGGVIRELDGELGRVVCIFYLTLRALDTIEDDMTLDPELKQSLLRDFHKHTVTPGWTFTGSGPNEQDRFVLAGYDVVVDEFLRLDAGYRDIIVDIALKMGSGMADFALRNKPLIDHPSTSEKNDPVYVQTKDEYNLYCHYVAGLVGEGCSALFAASGREASWLGAEKKLSNSMGLFLQKVNIIRDLYEDVQEQRYWWPREIWGEGKSPAPHAKSLPAFSTPEAMVDAVSTAFPASSSRTTSSPSSNTVKGRKLSASERKRALQHPQVREALWIQSAMILDAIKHAVDALEYLKCLKNQSVFGFCAIPQTMAIATLELCFMNPDMFLGNVKIRKAEAASLIMRSTNPRDVANIFVEYARRLHQKVDSGDPSWFAIGVVCGKIEQWREHHYPSFIVLADTPGAGSSVKFNPYDGRTKIMDVEKRADDALVLRRRMEQIRSEQSGGTTQRRLEPAPDATTDKEIILYVGAAILGIILLCLAIVGGVVYVTSGMEFS